MKPTSETETGLIPKTVKLEGYSYKVVLSNPGLFQNIIYMDNILQRWPSWPSWSSRSSRPQSLSRSSWPSSVGPSVQSVQLVEAVGPGRILTVLTVPAGGAVGPSRPRSGPVAPAPQLVQLGPVGQFEVGVQGGENNHTEL